MFSKAPTSFVDLPPDIFKLIGDMLPDVQSFAAMRRLSRQHKALVDGILTKPENVIYLVAHLPTKYRMGFIRYYRETDQFRRLKFLYASTSIEILLNRNDHLLNVFCYAISTDNIYSVPWKLVDATLDKYSQKLFGGNDVPVKLVLNNVKKVREFCYYTREENNYQKGMESLESGNPYEEDVEEQGWGNLSEFDPFFNLAGANFSFFEGTETAVENPEGTEEEKPVKIHLRGVLNGSNLERANLQFCEITCDLNYANLEYANLTAATLHTPALQGANFKYAKLDSAYLGYGEGCLNALEADFTGASIQNALFDWAIFGDTNFSDTKLNNTRFEGAVFYKCKFPVPSMEILSNGVDNFHDPAINVRVSNGNISMLVHSFAQDYSRFIKNKYKKNPEIALKILEDLLASPLVTYYAVGGPRNNDTLFERPHSTIRIFIQEIKDELKPSVKDASMPLVPIERPEKRNVPELTESSQESNKRNESEESSAKRRRS